jgi:uncharacterized protein YidB (DUF937 family)
LSFGRATVYSGVESLLGSFALNGGLPHPLITNLKSAGNGAVIRTFQ